jgi:hypothetical protein
MYGGIDALFRGAIAAVLTMPAALFLFWRLAHPLGVGRRWPRPFIACWASFGVIAAVGTLYAYQFERASFVDEAMTGALIMGGLLLLVAFLLLLLIPPRKA